MNKEYPVRPIRPEIKLMTNKLLPAGITVNCNCDNAAYLFALYLEIKRRWRDGIIVSNFFFHK